MSAHPEFAENMRASLVNPRRNIDRTVACLIAGDPKKALYFAEACHAQIDGTYAMAEAEAERNTHKCSCGHVHYLQAEDA